MDVWVLSDMNGWIDGPTDKFLDGERERGRDIERYIEIRRQKHTCIMILCKQGSRIKTKP